MIIFKIQYDIKNNKKSLDKFDNSAYADNKAKHLFVSGLSAPSDLRLFLHPSYVGGAENKRPERGIISRVLHHVFSPRRLSEKGLINKGCKNMNNNTNPSNNSSNLNNQPTNTKTPIRALWDAYQALQACPNIDDSVHDDADDDYYGLWSDILRTISKMKPQEPEDVKIQLKTLKILLELDGSNDNLSGFEKYALNIINQYLAA